MLIICCTTYNHENYINEALDGFLLQETDCPFEKIVRNDASDDNTAEIIKQYKKITIQIYKNLLIGVISSLKHQSINNLNDN